MQLEKNCKDIIPIWCLYNFPKLQLQFLHLLARHFKQLYERVYITKIRNVWTEIRIVGRIVQMCINLYKENKSLIFDVMKNGHIFPSKVWHFQYDHRFLSSSKMRNIRTCKEARLQELIKFRLSGQYLFWHFSRCLKMKNHLGRVSPSHFLQNVLIET